MRTRLVLAAVCILTLPLWYSAARRDTRTNSAPFAAITYAGHTVGGNWCACGTPGCIPDQGEICGNQARTTDDKKNASDLAAGTDVDPGAGLLMFALAFFLWTRLRA